MLFGSLYLDYGIGMAELDGVVQQIIQYLLDFSDIRIDVKFVSSQYQFNSDSLTLAGSLKGGRRVADDLIDVENVFIQQHTLSIQII